MRQSGLFGLAVVMLILSLMCVPGSGHSTELPDQRLIQAAHRNDVTAINVLLKEGVDLDARDAQGRTALLVAVDKNYIEVGTLLIEAGANVNVQDYSQDSPFLLAGARGNVELVKAMLNANPDFNLYNRFGGTALIPAAERGHVETVKVLLGTDLDVNHVNRLGWTALLEAIILGQGKTPHQEIVRALIEAGADVNLADPDGVTPLQHARKKGFKKIAALLEAAGAR